MTYSWSKMQAYLHCPRKFELSYIENLERIPGVESRPLLLGSAFHAGIADWLRSNDMQSAVSVALQTLADMTVVNKTYYDYEAGEYRDDAEYYQMIEELHHLMPKLLSYHLPRIGSQYRVAFLDEIHAVAAHVPVVEYEFEHGDYGGFVDAVLVDTVTGEQVLVDWKVRSRFPFDGFTSIDGQLPFYAAVLNKMGANISKAIMWQFRAKVPKPARINKNGLPSVAAQDTTWEVWCETVPPPIDIEKWEERVRPKLKTEADFQNPVEQIITPFSSELALSLARTTVNEIEREREQYPARLNTYACSHCDFWRLCSAPLKYGGDATDIIENEYRNKHNA